MKSSSFKTYLNNSFFSGQTSSGKSTLINKIMGIKLFKGRLAESTSTVCKIRNSDQIRIIATKNTGEILETNFPNKCNLQQKKDIRELRRVLKECTDHKYTSSDIGFQTVDIGLPVPFLKVKYAYYILKLDD